MVSSVFLTRGASLIGRGENSPAAHHPRRTWRGVNAAEAGAYVPSRAGGARRLSDHCAELARRTGHRVPVTFARAVGPHRARKTYARRAVEP